MINTVQNNQLTFGSKIRMSAKTVKALSLESMEIQRALAEELRMLEKNGRNDIVTVSFKEQFVRKTNPSLLTKYMVYSRKLLGLEIMEQRGVEHYSSKARKTITSMDENYDAPFSIMDLYRDARKQMKPFDRVSNTFLKYI